MSTVVCPVCGMEFEGWSTRCTTCGVALVPAGDAAQAVDGEVVEDDRVPEDQVVYELGEWPLDLQAAAAEALAEADIEHRWEGTDLMVHVDDEASVDALLEEIEREGGLVVDGVAPGEVGDTGELGEVVYELDDWSADEREELTRRLTEHGIAHRWEEDGAQLVIDGADEAVVEDLLDDVEFPDALPAEDDSDDVSDAEGPEDGAELLSSLFLAADRLKGNPEDADGLSLLITVTDQADPDLPPYGFAKAVWQDAINRADDIADLIADDEDRADEVVERAAALRNLLRPYV